MSETRDLIIIGAGHNGLVRRGLPGPGGAATAGARGARPSWAAARSPRRSTRASAAPPWPTPPVRCCPRWRATWPWTDTASPGSGPRCGCFAPALDGPSLALHDDPARTAAALKALGTRDAEAYPEFAASHGAASARALAPLLLDDPALARRCPAGAISGTC